MVKLWRRILETPGISIKKRESRRMVGVNTFEEEVAALKRESKKLGEAERIRLEECGIKIKPETVCDPISIRELMANECS